MLQFEQFLISYLSSTVYQIMASKNVDMPELGFWEKVDVPFARLTIATNALLAAITGVFRGQASPKKYNHHIIAAALRRLCDRTSDLQKQYVPSIPGNGSGKDPWKYRR